MEVGGGGGREGGRRRRWGWRWGDRRGRPSAGEDGGLEEGVKSWDRRRRREGSSEEEVEAGHLSLLFNYLLIKSLKRVGLV